MVRLALVDEQAERQAERLVRGAAAVMLLAMSTVLAMAAPALADDDLFGSLVGRKDKPLIDPGGFYAVVLPPGFDCAASPRHVKCQSNRGTQATLNIDVNDVPTSATVELLVLNQSDEFKKKPHYRLLSKKAVSIDGSKAMLATFTYDYNGNVDYPLVAQVLYVVKHTKAYIVAFESRGEHFGAHKSDLERVYGSFKTARLDGGGNPIIEDLEPKDAKRQDGLPDVKRALRGGF